MADLLVKLYDLPPLQPALDRCAENGVTIRRALAAEKRHVLAFVREEFTEGWVDECEVAFSHQPIDCIIATKDGKCVGFACIHATAPDFFGPTGVKQELRGNGIGAALLLAAMHDIRSAGYGYAIIGWAGPTGFYERTVGATVIENSSPGVYKGML